MKGKPSFDTSRLGNNYKITRLLISIAKNNPKRIVYPEADKLDVIKAAQIVQQTLGGDEDE